MKKVLIYSISIALFAIVISCKTGQKTISPDSSVIKGLWQHIGRSCDSSGHNCDKVSRGVELNFSDDSRFIVSGRQQGLYQTQSGYLYVKMGKKETKIKILYLSDKELVTQEVGKSNIDRFKRID